MGNSRVDFRRLYDEHYDAILGYFLRRADQTTAQDLTAEVFLVAWRRIDDVPRGEEALLWLYGVARNTQAHQRRRVARTTRLEHRLRSVPDPEPGEEPELQVVQRAEYEQVLAAAARLKTTDQEILRLAAWEELPHDQISRLLGISVAAVDQRLHRAKKRLTKEYRKHSAPNLPRTQEGGNA
jgi:RNA polymerase sigma-70 factor (ECF subfamily)